VKFRPGTRCVHSGTNPPVTAHGVTTPIVTATAYRYPHGDSEVVYPRYYNLSTQQAVASKIADLEHGASGLVLASGMAAITTTLMGLLRQGDRAIFHSGIYGGARSFVTNRLVTFGIDCALARGQTLEAFDKQLTPNTRLLFFESPTNPLLQVLDIREISEWARRHGILTVLDNTFATPINQNPLDLGVDVVVHSGTKYLNGHSDVNCGAIVTRDELMERILSCAVDFGGTLDVRACYLLERGLKTLALRVERQSENALRLAHALAKHSRVRAVHYPGLPHHPGHAIAARQMSRFGGMLSFELDADEAELRATLQRLRIATPAVSLGGVETLVCRPKETSHARMSAEERCGEGISDTLVRVSVGIEDAADLLADFEQALP
jgi:cystathionine beta-lyase/cystathionine gamma-synthase